MEEKNKLVSIRKANNLPFYFIFIIGIIIVIAVVVATGVFFYMDNKSVTANIQDEGLKIIDGIMKRVSNSSFTIIEKTEYSLLENTIYINIMGGQQKKSRWYAPWSWGR